MMLKESLASSRFTAIRNDALACCRDVPSIDPDVSMINIVSLGKRLCSASSSIGGMTMSNTYVSPLNSSLNKAALGASPTVGRHSRIKSLSAGALKLDNSIVYTKSDSVVLI